MYDREYIEFNHEKAQVQCKNMLNREMFLLVSEVILSALQACLAVRHYNKDHFGVMFLMIVCLMMNAWVAWRSLKRVDKVTKLRDDEQMYYEIVVKMLEEEDAVL